MNTQRIVTSCEIAGSFIAIVYTMLIASNTGREVLAFSHLLAGTIPFGIWALIDRKWAFLSLQLFYVASAIVGLLRWGDQATSQIKSLLIYKREGGS